LAVEKQVFRPDGFFKLGASLTKKINFFEKVDLLKTFVPMFTSEFRLVN